MPGVGFFGRSEDGDWEANLSARISGLRLAYGWTFSSGSGSRATSGLAGIIKFKREDVILPQCGVSTAEDEPGASTGARSWYSGMPTRSSLNRSGFKPGTRSWKPVIEHGTPQPRAPAIYFQQELEVALQFKQHQELVSWMPPKQNDAISHVLACSGK